MYHGVCMYNLCPKIIFVDFWIKNWIQFSGGCFEGHRGEEQHHHVWSQDQGWGGQQGNVGSADRTWFDKTDWSLSRIWRQKEV